MKFSNLRALPRVNTSKQLILMAGVFTLSVMAASFNLANNQVGATVPGTNSRVSLTGTGAQPSQESTQGAISRNGRYAVFLNAQNNFVGSDTNNKTDAFVRDLTSGAVTRSSVSTAGVGGDQNVTWAVISETGRYVVFSSAATNLLDGRSISPTYAQLYIRDTVSNTTNILTEVSPGTFANSSTTPYDVSADGRFVLFRSAATNLGPSITNGAHNNVFLLDRTTNTVTWVNAEAPGISGGTDPLNAQMSCDGSLIVFDANAYNLGMAYSPHLDVILLDRRGSDRLTNITASANNAAVNAHISCNGDYIGFASKANNLDPITAGMSVGYHGYLYDRINDQFKLVDQTSSGTLANANIMGLFSDAFYFNLSDNGAAVFRSTATNLDSAATSGQWQIYIRNTKTGTTELLTRDSGGTEGNGESRLVTLTADGKKAVYESYATNLISGDTNALRDIFVSDTGL
jgi:hypothetical protein